MAKRLQHRGGTTSQHSTFTGAVREVTVDTDKNTLVVHDGATAGGHPLATTTNFTSTGIDDNATSTALTINSANNATFSGIVTADEFNLSTSGDIHAGSTASQMTIAGGSNSNVGSNVSFYGSTHASLANVVRFRADASETMRIDSSGNVGIGTTSPAPAVGSDTALEVAGSVSPGLVINDTGQAQKYQLYADSTKFKMSYGSTNFFTYDASNGNIGIGTASPAVTLQVNGGVQIDETSLSLDIKGNSILCADGKVAGFGGDYVNAIYKGTGTEALVFRSNNAERIRIDSSGRLLVNTTSYLQDSDEKLSVNGIGTFQRAGNTAIFNRTGSDGDAIRIEKDGAVVGSIGVKDSAFLYLGNGDTGLKFTNTTDAITPADGSNGTGRNNAIDLGTSSSRFKDLYLGGGLYVGGTGTANKLDDYEEGTWTPAYMDGTGGFNATTLTLISAVYTKIGDLVHLSAIFSLNGSSISVGDSFRISGNPFTAEEGNYRIGSFSVNASVAGNNMAVGTIGAASSDGAGMRAILTQKNGTVSATNSICINVTYQTA